MKIDNHVVISSFQKDYELQSWNEQGEITQIEGMLTICFLVVSLCSHIDKKLYLIIKIHYLVNMPMVDKENGNVYEAWVENPELKQKIKKLELENERLKKTNIELEKLKKENQRLKIISGEAKSGWHKELDWIERNNLDTGEPEGYRCPPDFDISKVYGFERYFNEEKCEKWCSFQHPYLDWSRYDFSMPNTAYLWLKGELPEQKKKEIKQTPKKDRLIKFDSPNLLIQYFKETLDKKYYSYTLIEVFIPFIFENIKKSFDREAISEYCKTKRGKKPVPATIHKHLNLLIEHNILYRKYKGIYEVNEQSINYD